MIMEFHDFVGFSGAIAILIAYFLLQAAESLIYSLLNLIGAILILFSLANAWNLTAVFIEIIWLGISLFGVLKWYKESYSKKVDA
jgi:hypothetical protein